MIQEANFGSINRYIIVSTNNFLPFQVFFSEHGLDFVLEKVNVTFKRCDFFKKILALYS